MKKWLCAVLIAAMLCANGLPVLAEDAELSAPREEALDFEGDVLWEDEDAPAETEVMLGEEPEQPGEATEESEKAVEEEAQPAGTLWYAALTGGAEDERTVYRDGAMTDALTTLRGGDALLVTDVRDGVASVAFDSEEGAQEGYIEEAFLTALDAEGLSALLNGIVTAGGDIACYGGNLDYLLPRLVCAIIHDEAETLADPNGPVSAIALNYTSLAMGRGETCKLLSATLEPADAEATLTWKSGNAAVVKVNARTGALTGVSVGTATVTVTAGGAKASCRVRVGAKPSRLTLNPSSVALYVNGAPHQMARPTMGKGEASATISVKSSDESVATVSDSGLVTPVGKGSATITLETYNGKQAKLSVVVYGQPDHVEFTRKELNIYAGQRIVPAAIVVDADGAYTPGSVTYAVSEQQEEDFDAGCLVCAEDGRSVEGVRQGKAYVNARFGDSVVSGEPCLVNVVAAPEEIVLDCAELAIGLGEVRAGAGYTLNPAGTAATVTWSSSKPAVVKVDAATGALKGVKKGSAVITAATHNGRTATCLVRVVDAPKKLTLAQTAATLYDSGETVQIQGVVNSGAASALSYSGGGDVASVDAGGLVTAKASGTANITVRTYNGKTATFALTVVAPVARVSIPEEFTIAELQKKNIGAVAYDASGAVTQASFSYACDSETGSATIDETGLVTGVKLGSATVTVSATSVHHQDDVPFTAASTVTVVKGPRTVSLGSARGTIGVGENIDLSPRMLDENGEEISGTLEVKSSRSTVAAVNEAGVVQGRKAGTTMITFTAFNGVTASRIITVKPAPTSVTITPARPELGVGQTRKLTATLSKKSAGGYAFYSDNPAVASVDADGNLTGVSQGTAKITVQTYVKSVRASVTVSVGAAPVYVRLTNVTSQTNARDSGSYETVYWKTLRAGDSFALKAAVEYPAKGDIASYASSDPGVAEINSAGVITALKPGVTEITVTATGGAQAACTLYVLEGSEEPTKPYEPVITPGGDGTRISFTNSDLTMAVGTVRRPEITDQLGNTITEAALSVDAPGVVEVKGDSVTALSAGTAIVTAEFGGATATMRVTVYEDSLTLQPASYKGWLSEGGVQLSTRFGDGGTGGEVSFESSDGSVATVSEKGYVAFHAAGTAVITATTRSGKTASSKITVLQDGYNYRLFTAYGYDMNLFTGSGKLPFTRNNARSVYDVFVGSALGYTPYANLQNPTKLKLLNQLKSYVNAAQDNDVSLIYICTHGHSFDETNHARNYAFSLSAHSGSSAVREYVSSRELFSAISGGRGKVVLILDTCYSGCFIADMRSELQSKGSIAVLTAATNTSASFYRTGNPNQGIDFFTYFMLLGTGFDERGHYYVKDDKYSKGAAPGYMLADSTDNPGAKDGVITLKELFDYARKCVVYNVPNYSFKSWFWGSADQTPNSFLGENGNLVMYRQK